MTGLFPVLHVAKALQSWGAPQFRYYDDSVRRLFIAGFVLHDWLKLPESDAELENAVLPQQFDAADQVANQLLGVYQQTAVEEQLTPEEAVAAAAQQAREALSAQ